MIYIFFRFFFFLMNFFQKFGFCGQKQSTIKKVFAHYFLHPDPILLVQKPFWTGIWLLSIGFGVGFLSLIWRKLCGKQNDINFARFCLGTHKKGPISTLPPSVLKKKQGGIRFFFFQNFSLRFKILIKGSEYPRTLITCPKALHKRPCKFISVVGGCGPMIFEHYFQLPINLLILCQFGRTRLRSKALIPSFGSAQGLSKALKWDISYCRFNRVSENIWPWP